MTRKEISPGIWLQSTHQALARSTNGILLWQRCSVGGRCTSMGGLTCTVPRRYDLQELRRPQHSARTLEALACQCRGLSDVNPFNRVTREMTKAPRRRGRCGLLFDPITLADPSQEMLTYTRCGLQGWRLDIESHTVFSWRGSRWRCGGRTEANAIWHALIRPHPWGQFTHGAGSRQGPGKRATGKPLRTL